MTGVGAIFAGILAGFGIGFAAGTILAGAIWEGMG
jgi:hypothetical protein